MLERKHTRKLMARAAESMRNQIIVTSVMPPTRERRSLRHAIASHRRSEALTLVLGRGTMPRPMSTTQDVSAVQSRYFPSSLRTASALLPTLSTTR